MEEAGVVKDGIETRQERAAPLYFAMTFGVSWGAALCVALPWILRGQRLPDLAGILMFPAMLIGPPAVGLVMTARTTGTAGLRTVGLRLRHWRLGRWSAVLMLPPILIYTVLQGLRLFVSPAFAPNAFLVGVLFGIPAGYLEEIGWMGYAFDQLRARRSALRAAVILGAMWATWHLPVVDFLGAAHPHGRYWLLFFLAFGAAMIAMRVLISWLYVNTHSLLGAQLLHMSSTGALVVFGAPGVNSLQEGIWYGAYALVLWVAVVVIVRSCGPELTTRHTKPSPTVDAGSASARAN